MKAELAEYSRIYPKSHLNSSIPDCWCKKCQLIEHSAGIEKELKKRWIDEKLLSGIFQCSLRCFQIILVFITLSEIKSFFSCFYNFEKFNFAKSTEENGYSMQHKCYYSGCIC